jgi:iron complex transport system substrate-binding protein
MRRRLFVQLAFAVRAWSWESSRRIVSLSPNITELLYGIGALNQLAGISDFCTYPPEVKKLPVVAAWHTVYLEKLTNLRPDLVMLDDGQAPFVADRLTQLGFELKIIAVHTVEDVYRAMMTLGEATAHEQAAARLVAVTRKGLERVRSATAALDKPKVMLIVDRTPGTLRDLNCANGSTYLGQLVTIAGGRVVAPNFPRGYGKISKEDLVVLNPDVILDFIHGTKIGNPMDAWTEMPELQAVRGRRVHGVNEDYVPRASQRIVQTAQLFARLIHPEAK